MNKHKRRKRLKANRHKKRTWQKWAASAPACTHPSFRTRRLGATGSFLSPRLPVTSLKNW